MPPTLRALTFALLTVPLALSGCDAIEEAAGLNDVAVSLGSAGDNLPVVANSVEYTTDDVSVGRDIPGSPGVDGIAIDREDVSFTPVAARGASAGAASCDLTVTMLIDFAPAITANVGIENDAVASVNVGYARADYDREQLCEAIGAASCPVGDLSSSQIDDIVEAALNSGGFEVGFVVDNPGDCQGTLDVDEVTFDLSL